MKFDPARMVRVSRFFDVPAERVFDAWLDPATAGKWLFTTPAGTMVRVEIDARVGGAFNFTRRDGEDIEHVGKYLEIDRPRRLVFELGVPKFSKEVTRVSIDIVPTASGCELTLTHEGVLPEWMDKTRGGWGKILDGLAHDVDANGKLGVVTEPGTIRFERLLPGPIERVWSYLTDSKMRAKWFAEGLLENWVGGTIELNFHHATLTADPSPVPEKFKELAKPEGGPFFEEKVTKYDAQKVLAWQWDAGEGGPSEVTFELSPKGDKVLLVLTHRRLAAKHLTNVAAGWHTHLALLAERLHGREPVRFWAMIEDLEAVYEAKTGVSKPA